MNILLLHGSSDLYGASKILVYTLETFTKAGHSCIVLLPTEGALSNQIRTLGIQVEILNLAVVRKKYFNIPGIANRISRFSKAKTKIIHLIQAEKIDLVFTNTVAVWVGAFAAKKMNLPHIWHIHEIIEKPIVLKKLLNILLNRMSTKVICVSDAVQSNWKSFIDPKKLIRIYNGINLTIHPIEKKSLGAALNLGMAGRIHYWKGQLYFLAIAKELLKINPKLIFHIAGDPFPGYEYLLNDMKNFIRTNQMEEHVIYHGLVKDMDLFYAQLDILILPSTLPDPFPTVILEAMAHELPVVATAHGGALEMIVENETGIFIPWNDAIESSNRIQKLLDQNARYAMGKKGRDRLQKLFSKASYEKNMLNVLETI